MSTPLTASDLKPCPFCGNAKTVEIWEGLPVDADWVRYERWTVVCDVTRDGCGASGGYYHEVRLAIENWNRRHVAKKVTKKKRSRKK